MCNSYRPVLNNVRLRNFLQDFLNLDILRCLKYRTKERESESVHHNGWYNVHLYSIGVYELTNGISISFNYCYEMDPLNIKNIKRVISCNFEFI